MKYAITFIIMLCCTIIGINSFMNQLKITQLQRDSESYCIGQFISMGYERIDIKTEEGSCYYEPNGYYR